MSDHYFVSMAAGFLSGLMPSIIGAAVLAKTHDLPMTHIQAAIDVCEAANSMLVSTDWVEATCANKAVIPYEVKK